MFLHIDIDSFFASAECSVNPKLKGLPICVGSRSNLEIFHTKPTGTRLINKNTGAFVAPVFHSSQKRTFENYFIDIVNENKKIRGIVTTASYEARAKGVKTAMPIAKALKLCPEMIVLPSNYSLYHTLSHKLYTFIQTWIPRVEQYSIDEFFGDLSGWVRDEEAYKFSKNLQADILEHFDLPVSIGISKAKWIAKLATESAKPYGIYEVKNIDAYIEDIPIDKFPGIGKGFQKRLSEHYIRTLGEAKRNKALFYRWKKPGIRLYKRITGRCNEGISLQKKRKSIGISRTFDAIYDHHEIRRRIAIMARHIVYMATDLGVNPTTYYLKINYEYGIKRKQNQRCERLFSEHLFKAQLYQMHKRLELKDKGAVKLSLSVYNFDNGDQKTFSLLNLHYDIKYHRLTKVLHTIRKKFGLDMIKTANEL